MDPLSLNRSKQKRRSFVSVAANIVSSVVSSAVLLVATQALYVALTTPRLPPPPNSGHDFEENGLLIRYTTDETSTTTNVHHQKEEGERNGDDRVSDGEDPDSEFCLVLVGDSPVEGIGNRKHFEALGGQTALAFSKVLRRSVRYWSYGKSGLTARGVEEKMVPLVHKLSERYRIDAIVTMCGVNNVLTGHSPVKFGKELRGLLDSLIPCCRCHLGFSGNTKIIVVDLIDFALLPFLPFPLSKLLSWRSRTLQTELEAVVSGYGKEDEVPISIAYMPHVSEILENNDNNLLLEHIISEEQRDSLRLDQFFADDNFHPALLGNALMGKVIVDTYSQQLLDIDFGNDADLTQIS